MAKWLLVGDPHAVADELDDCRALISCIIQAVKDHSPDYVLFLGDQHHNHAIMHVEVMAFWRDAFRQIGKLQVPVIALVGNHDMPGDGASKSHAMMAYADMPEVRVVERPEVINGHLFIPYQHSNETFLSILKDHPHQRVVVCHQTFDGGRYENGFFAKNGVPLAGLEDRWFISGHIHTPQAFGNVTYIGAPRWRSLSDVGIERALVMVELHQNEQPQYLKLIDTGTHCAKIVHIVETPEKLDTPVNVKPGWKAIVDIHGDEDFIKARSKLWVGHRVRTFKTRTTSAKVSESMGIAKALQAFLEGYQPRYGTQTAILKEMVATRLGIR